MTTDNAIYTFRTNGMVYRIRKAPTEPDDDAADRGWWIAKHQDEAKGQHAQIYSQSLQFIQAKNLGMVWEK